MDLKTQVRFVDLPMELIIDILLRLPVKALLRLKCVSKFWCNLIGSHDFINRHLNKYEKVGNEIILIVGRSYLYSFDFNSPQGRAIELCCPSFMKMESISPWRKLKVSLIGSCNGLVCLYELKDKCYSLYNPTTGAYYQIPRLSGIDNYDDCVSCSDFAYDCVADDYKVLEINENYKLLEGRRYDEVEVYVYSLKTNSWKAVPNLMTCGLKIHSVVVDNFWHAIERSPDGSPFIMRVNFSTQQIDTLSLPRDIIGDFPCLSMLRGYLHVMTEGVDIWVMKEYGVETSWTRLFYYSLNSIQKIWYEVYLTFPVAYSKDGLKILLAHRMDLEYCISCDLQSQTMTKFQIEGLPEDCSANFFVVPWVESLVSPFRPTQRLHHS